MSISFIEKIAFNESLKTTEDAKQHFGCVILKNNNKVVSRGHNFRSFGITEMCYCHAEMDAIYHHLQRIGLWKDFQAILKYGYAMTGILTRLEGRAS